MHIADTLAGERLVGQPPRFQDEERDFGEKFPIPIQKFIENINKHVPTGTAIVDGRLPALGAVRSTQRGIAIFAMRQRSMPIFASTEPAPTRSSLDSGNRCITEDNLCRFIGHTSASLQKDFLGVD